MPMELNDVHCMFSNIPGVRLVDRDLVLDDEAADMSCAIDSNTPRIKNIMTEDGRIFILCPSDSVDNGQPLGYYAYCQNLPTSTIELAVERARQWAVRLTKQVHDKHCKDDEDAIDALLAACEN